MWWYFWVYFGYFWIFWVPDGRFGCLLDLFWIFWVYFCVIFGNILDLFDFFGYVVVFLGIICIRTNVCPGSFGSFGLLWLSPNLIWNNICPDKCWSGPACRHPKWVRTSVCPGTCNYVPAYHHGIGLSHKVGRTLNCSFALIRLNIGHSEVGICGQTSVDQRLSEVYTYTFGSFWIFWVCGGIL